MRRTWRWYAEHPRSLDVAVIDMQSAALRRWEADQERLAAAAAEHDDGPDEPQSAPRGAAGVPANAPRRTPASRGMSNSPVVHEIGEWCGPSGRHLPIVIYTRRPRDLFRRRYWVKCWECDLSLGPFRSRGWAESERAIIEQGAE